MCERLKAASRDRGGLDWQRALRRYARPGTRGLRVEELVAAVRGEFRIPPPLMSDVDVRLLFKHMDAGGRGEVQVQEIFDFIEKRVPLTTEDAAGGTAGFSVGRLTRIRERLRALVEQRGACDWPRMFRRYSKPGEQDEEALPLVDLRSMLRRELQVPQGDLTDSDLRSLFHRLEHDGSGVVRAEDFRRFLESTSPCEEGEEDEGEEQRGECSRSTSPMDQRSPTQIFASAPQRGAVQGPAGRSAGGTYPRSVSPGCRRLARRGAEAPLKRSVSPANRQTQQAAQASHKEAAFSADTLHTDALQKLVGTGPSALGGSRGGDGGGEADASALAVDRPLAESDIKVGLDQDGPEHKCVEGGSAHVPSRRTSASGIQAELSHDLEAEPAIPPEIRRQPGAAAPEMRVGRSLSPGVPSSAASLGQQPRTGPPAEEAHPGRAAQPAGRPPGGSGGGGGGSGRAARGGAAAVESRRPKPKPWDAVQAEGVVLLNVGGEATVEVLLSTLRCFGGSRLDRMFAPGWERRMPRDFAGRPFLDARADLFVPLVQFLRECRLARDAADGTGRPQAEPPLPTFADPEQAAAFARMLEHYGLTRYVMPRSGSPVPAVGVPAVASAASVAPPGASRQGRGISATPVSEGVPGAQAPPEAARQHRGIGATPASEGVPRAEVLPAPRPRASSTSPSPPPDDPTSPSTAALRKAVATVAASLAAASAEARPCGADRSPQPLPIGAGKVRMKVPVDGWELLAGKYLH